MDWDKLRIFHVVADAGSLTNAGKVLNLSQPAVSRQITQLEADLGIALFRRHARGLVLTEQGEMLHQTTLDVFAKLNSIRGQLSDTHQSEEGPLTIAVSEFIGSIWLAPKLAGFLDKHPQVQLTVLFEDRVLNLNMKQADAALRLQKPTESGLVMRFLNTIHFHVCASKDYLSKYGAPKSVDDLKNHRLIAFPDHVLVPFENPSWVFDIAGVKPETDNNVLMMNSMYAIHKACTTGSGIAVLPDFFIEDKEELEVILPNLERPTVDLYFVYAEERRNSKRMGLFRDFLLESVENTTFSAKF